MAGCYQPVSPTVSVDDFIQIASRLRAEYFIEKNSV